MNYEQQRAYLDPDYGALTFGRPVQATGALAGFASVGLEPAVQMQEDGPTRQRESEPGGECEVDRESVHGEGLSESERNTLFTRLVGRLGSAYTNFGDACDAAEETLTSRATSGADLAIAIISGALDLVAPKLVSSVLREVVAGVVRADAADRVYRAAVFLMDRSDELAKRINSAAEGALRSEVLSRLADPRTAFISVLRQAFDRSKLALEDYVGERIGQPAALPDEELVLYLAKWRVGVTVEEYHSIILDLVEQYMSQVYIIGQFGDMAELAYWVQSPSARLDLAILDGVGPYQHYGENPEGRFRGYRFRSWVRPEFQNEASYRMRQLCGCNPPIVDASTVTGLAELPEWEESEALPSGISVVSAAAEGPEE